MREGEGTKQAGRGRGLFRTAILLVLLLYVLWSLSTQWHLFVDALSPSRLPWLAAALVLSLAATLLIGLRQMILLSDTPERVGFKRSVEVTFAGEFANNILPAGTGTDLVRLLYFRGAGGRTADIAGGLIVLDRLLGMIALGGVAGAAFIPLTMLTPGSASAAGALLRTVLAILAVLLFGLLALRSRALRGVVWGGKTLQGILGSLHEQTKRGRTILAVTLLAVAGHLLGMVSVGCIALGVSSPTEAATGALLSPLVFFAASVPVTPSNLGWTEAMAEATWTAFGLHGGLIVFLLRRLVSVVASLLGVGAYCKLMRSGRQQPPAA